MMRVPQGASRPAPALWSAPFHVFFPSAALSAALMILPWLTAHLSGWVWSMPGGALAWHMHDMVFGFGMAAVGGFLLTALPAWTGAPLLRGYGLAAVWAAWLLARILALRPEALPAPLSMILLVTPTAILCGLIAWIALRHAQGRHAVFGVAALALLAVHAAFTVLWLGLAPTAVVAALVEPLALAGIASPLRWLGDLGILLLVLIHGATIARVMPVLAPEALRLSASPRVFQPDPARARVTTLTLGVMIGAFALAPGSAVAGWLAWAAAAAQLDRLGVIWIGRAAARHSFVHGFLLAKLFLIIALALFGAARLLDLPWLDAAWHAAAAGTLAVGCLSVFGVATCRHTGGALPLPWPATLAIWLAAAGAAARIAAPFAWDVGLAPALFWIGGGLWSGAFLVFLLGHARRLLWAAPGRPISAHSHQGSSA